MRENLKHREELTEGIKEAASTLLEDVEELGKVAREAASDSLEYAQKNVRKRFREVESQFEGYARKHPMRIVLLAAGAGFLLGFLKRNHR